MTFPPDNLCIDIPDIADVEDVCLPGGICLSYVFSGIGKVPSIADAHLDFLSQLGPAMTPLQPFFKLLETALAIFKCLKAIPKAITQLNPKELIECFPALAKSVDQLLKLIPQLSVPMMVKSIIVNVANLLLGICQELTDINERRSRIESQIIRAVQLGDLKMNGLLVCAQNTLNDTSAAMGKSLEAVGRIIMLINVFGGLIGMQEIPCFSKILTDNLGVNTSEIISVLQDLAQLLIDISSAVPDPNGALAKSLGDASC